MQQTMINDTLYANGQAIALENLAWNQHPTCAGVALKHLLTSADTEGKFSLHLVRVAAGAQISAHMHATQAELHQVIAGTGQCNLAGQMMAYAPGVFALIPAGQTHEVSAAADEDLYLIATFAPPLR